ncbi:MAG: hypothetical protein CMG46_02665 [Candidatus Marinimicrobia bacterium]|nr:hypothetical protein [Candidatus Neomarinimicrobiota bacterium]
MSDASIWNTIDCQSAYTQNTENISGTCMGSVATTKSECNSSGGTWAPGISSHDYPTGCPEGCTYNPGLKLYESPECILNNDTDSEYTFDIRATCIELTNETDCFSDSNCIWHQQRSEDKCLPKTDNSCNNYFRNPAVYTSNIEDSQVNVCLPGCKFNPNDLSYCKSIDIVNNKDLCGTYQTIEPCLNNEMCKWENEVCKLKIDNCSTKETKEECYTDTSCKWESDRCQFVKLCSDSSIYQQCKNVGYCEHDSNNICRENCGQCMSDICSQKTDYNQCQPLTHYTLDENIICDKNADDSSLCGDGCYWRGLPQGTETQTGKKCFGLASCKVQGLISGTYGTDNILSISTITDKEGSETESEIMITKTDGSTYDSGIFFEGADMSGVKINFINNGTNQCSIEGETIISSSSTNTFTIPQRYSSSDITSIISNCQIEIKEGCFSLTQGDQCILLDANEPSCVMPGTSTNEECTVTSGQTCGSGDLFGCKVLPDCSGTVDATSDEVPSTCTLNECNAPTSGECEEGCGLRTNRTCTETATDSVPTDSTACRVVDVSDPATAQGLCEAVMTNADNTVQACTYSLNERCVPEPTCPETTDADTCNAVSGCNSVTTPSSDETCVPPTVDCVTGYTQGDASTCPTGCTLTDAIEAISAADASCGTTGTGTIECSSIVGPSDQADCPAGCTFDANTCGTTGTGTIECSSIVDPSDQTDCPAGCTFQPAQVEQAAQEESCTATVTDCTTGYVAGTDSCPTGCVFTPAVEEISQCLAFDCNINNQNDCNADANCRWIDEVVGSCSDGTSQDENACTVAGGTWTPTVPGFCFNRDICTNLSPGGDETGCIGPCTFTDNIPAYEVGDSCEGTIHNGECQISGCTLEEKCIPKNTDICTEKIQSECQETTLCEWITTLPTTCHLEKSASNTDDILPTPEEMSECNGKTTLGDGCALTNPVNYNCVPDVDVGVDAESPLPDGICVRKQLCEWDQNIGDNGYCKTYNNQQEPLCTNKLDSDTCNTSGCSWELRGSKEPGEYARCVGDSSCSPPSNLYATEDEIPSLCETGCTFEPYKEPYPNPNTTDNAACIRGLTDKKLCEKINTVGEFPLESSDCPETCYWDDTLKQCKDMDDTKCLLTEVSPGVYGKRTKTECDTEVDGVKACEWKNSTFDGIPLNERLDARSNPLYNGPQCQLKEDASCDDTLDQTECSNESGCKWKCKIPNNHVDMGYEITPLDNSDIDYDKYYNQDEITAECSSESSGTPVVNCLLTNDTYVLEGCIKNLKCIGNDISSWKTNEGDIIIRNEFSNDIGDLDGFNPNSNGDFPCPLPYSITTDETLTWTTGTDEEKIQKCCEKVGLCSGNDDPTTDIECPEGKQIKKGPNGIDIKGSDIGNCCKIPSSFDIELILNGNYDTTVGSNKVLKDEFKGLIKEDIVNIINQGNTIISDITVDHIEIISIKKGSIKILFKVNPDESGKMITREEITDLFTVGKSLDSLGITIRSIGMEDSSRILFTIPSPFGGEIRITKKISMNILYGFLLLVSLLSIIVLIKKIL